MYHDVVTVAPDVRIVTEVGFPVFYAPRVVPEIQRHGRRRSFTDQLSRPVDYRLPVLIVTLYFHTQGGALNFTGVYRQCRAALNKTAVDIGTPRDGTEMQVGLDCPVDELKPGRGQGRAGLGNLPQARQVIIIPRPEILAHQIVNIAGAGAEDGYLFLLCHLPQRPRTRIEGVTVI